MQPTSTEELVVEMKMLLNHIKRFELAENQGEQLSSQETRDKCKQVQDLILNFVSQTGQIPTEIQESIQEVNKILHQYKMQITVPADDINFLLSHPVQALHLERQILLRQITTLQRERDEYATKFENVVRQSQHHYSQIKLLQDLNREFEQQNKSLLEQNAKLQEEVEILKKEKAILQEEITFLKSNLASIDSTLQDTRQELAETKQELAETKQELAETKQELAETKQELAETRQELAETKQELSETRQELAETKKDLDTTKVDVQMAKERAVVGQLAFTFERLIAIHVLGYKPDSKECHYFKFSHLKEISLTSIQKTKYNNLIAKVGFDPRYIGGALSAMKKHRLIDAHRINTDDSGISANEAQMRQLIKKHGPSIDKFASGCMEDMVKSIVELHGSFELLNS